MRSAGAIGLALLIGGHCSATADALPPKLVEELDTIISNSGFSCFEISSAEMLPPDHYGDVFKVTCTVESLRIEGVKSQVSYRVTLPLVRQPRVEPWR